MQESCDITKAYQLAYFAILIAAVAAENAVAAARDHISAVDGSKRLLCGEGQQCPWKLPPIPTTRCCPKEMGENCHPAIYEFCNHEFGLLCLGDNSSLPTEGPGTCMGLYNLTASSIGQTEATLTWISFLPPDYRDEYVMLLRKGAYHRDISQWDIRYCGDEPQCLARRLEHDSLYFAKMATLKDERTMTLANSTETIVFRTKSVEYCEGSDKQHKVGESFIHDQEENCTCLSSGKFDCVPLCPNGIPEVEEGCRIFLGEECQYNITCNLEEGFEGREEDELCHRYPDGTVLRFDCRVCRCVQEKLECSYSAACSPKPSCKHIKEIKIPGQCCPEWDCDDVCQYENKSYSAGELFASEICGLCQCQPTGKVECVANCPPVEMVAPSRDCPTPHIKRSGCCDTLHCFNGNPDSFSYVHKLEVLYSTAVSLTLGFKVEPACETNGRPSYCRYRIQYANISSNHEPLVWKNHVVHPVDLMNDGHPKVSHPIDVFTTDSAIVINSRVLITLTGMYPGTEFYVMVTQEEEDREDMTDIEHSSVVIGHNSRTAKVVAKTRPLQNDTSCFYAGKEVLHSEIVTESCNHACQCTLGQIECHSTCSDEKIIIAPSLSCPQPRLEKRPADCCPKWRCYPSVSGCRYNDAILRPGQVISNGCQECICNKSTIMCTSLCPALGPSPRPGCVLTNNTSSHCYCPQWSCTVERSSPIAVENSVLLKFWGICRSPIASFKKHLATGILKHITNLINCSDYTTDNDLCNGLDVQVTCKSKYSAPENRIRRAGADQFITVLVSVRRNFSSEKDLERVFRSGLDLQRLLNISFDLHLDNRLTYRSSSATQLRKPVYICQHGFLYKNGECVLSEIDMVGFQWAKVVLSALDISSKTVTFQWPSLNENLHIQTLQIKYRLKGTITWSTTKTLQPWRNSITVSGLQPGSSYDAFLEAVTQKYNEHKWSLGVTSFDTQPLPEPVSPTIILEVEYVLANCIILSWGHLTPEFQNQIQNASIFYWVASSNQTHKQSIRKEKPLAKIEDLSSGTEYTVQLRALMSNEKILHSSSLRITTPPSEKCAGNILMPVLIAVFGVVVLGLIMLLVWLCRRGQKKGRSFENKGFGMALENNTGSSNTNNSSSS